MAERIVTTNEILKFIFSQDDDRVINYGENEIDDSCGCLMIQFARHEGIPCKSVGVCSWIGEETEDGSYKLLAKLDTSERCSYSSFGRFAENAKEGLGVTTYGAAKKYCLSKFQERCQELGLDINKG